MDDCIAQSPDLSIMRTLATYHHISMFDWRSALHTAPLIGKIESWQKPHTNILVYTYCKLADPIQWILTQIIYRIALGVVSDSVMSSGIA